MLRGCPLVADRVLVPAALVALLILSACPGSIDMLDAAPDGDGGAADARGDAAGPDAGPGAALEIDVATHDFGDAVIGGSAMSLAVMVRNVGGSDSGRLGTVMTGAGASQFGFLSNGCEGKSLAPGHACLMVVDFLPTAAGDAVAILAVDATPGGAVTSQLSGHGLEPGALAIAPMMHDYGAIVLGAPPPSFTYTATNTGGAKTGTLAVSLGGAQASEFVITADACTGAVLPPGASCQVTVLLGPLSPGGKSASLVVQALPGGAAVASLVGQGQTPATLQAAPSNVDFGPVTQGTPSPPIDVVVKNAGQQASGAIGVSLGGAQAAQFVKTADGCSGQTLAGGASCTITLRYAPAATGAASATLAVSGAPGGAANVPLSGLGLLPANLSLAPAAHDYGGVVIGQASATFTFGVQNLGQSPSGALAASVTGANPADFTILADGCSGLVLGPAASCSMIVAMTPTAAGARAATLQVVGAPGGTRTAALTGTGLLPASLSLAPATHDFGNITAGQQSGAFGYTVTNGGQVASSAPVVSLVGAGASQFTQTNTCGAAVPAGGTCTVNVRFAPSSAGAASATVQVVASTGGTTTAQATGTGLSPAALAIAPASQSFGTVVVGQTSANLPFTVTNTGQSPSGALSVALGGVDGGQWQQVSTTCGASLAGGASCQVTIRFKPTVAGTKTASLGASAAPGGSVASSLSGVAITPAALAIAPAPFSYGTLTIGQSASRTFTVSNTGQQTSGTIGVTLDNTTDFAITSNSCAGASLLGGASCTIVVKFGALAPAGGKSATLAATAAPGGTASSSLSATSQTPASLSIAPAPFDFGGVLIGQTSANQDFTVTNTGQQSSTVPAVSLVGADAGEFEIVANGCSAALAGGASCTITARFKPLTRGARSAQLSVVAATGGSAAATLGGTAQANATLGLGPAAFDFGAQAVTTSGSPQTYTLTNSGDVASGLVGTTFAGDTLDFQVTDGCSGVTLAAGGSCTIVVTFAPLTPGPKSLSIGASATPGGVASASATGTATP